MHKKTHGQQPLCLCPPQFFPSSQKKKKENTHARTHAHRVIRTKNSSVVPPVFSLRGYFTFIVVLNLISKWACWLQKPDNEECNLSGHKHRCVHIGEHRCSPREVQLLQAFDFTSVITISFVLHFFWSRGSGGSVSRRFKFSPFICEESFIQHQTLARESQSPFISTDTLHFCAPT